MATKIAENKKIDTMTVLIKKLRTNMPQLTLTLSNNINCTQINFDNLFAQIHKALQLVPDLDVATAHSGVIQETYSCIGFNNYAATKIYLQLYWLENKTRAALRTQLGKILLGILEDFFKAELAKRSLNCAPRVRIANLGVVNDSYFISQS